MSPMAGVFIRRRALLGWLLVGTCLPRAATAREGDEALWTRLQAGGHVVLLRHAATEPGVGDPPGFALGDCGTQRNLSAQGRRDAQRLGTLLRARRVPVARVLSSPWCRCLDTARLVFGREAEVEPALGNLFGRPERAAQQVAQLRRLLRAEAGNVFMVTHGSTIAALTGVSPAQGEMVVLSPQGGGDFGLAGRLAPP